MPTYDYLCLNCGKKFTQRLTITEHDKRRPKCPKCGSAKTSQQIEPFFAMTEKKS